MFTVKVFWRDRVRKSGTVQVRADQVPQAFDEARGLPARHARQHLHCQAPLYGGITTGLLSPASAHRRSIPAHPRLKPDHTAHHGA